MDSEGVMLTPENNDDLERILLAYSPKFQAMLENSRKSLQATDGVEDDQFWQKVDEQSKSV